MNRTILLWVAALLMAMPADLNAKKKKIFYLTNASNDAEAYFNGEVDDAGNPDGEGVVVVERGKGPIICKGDELLRLTGTFGKDGVTNAVLTLNTEPTLTFRGRLSYVRNGGSNTYEIYQNDKAAYEIAEKKYSEDLQRFRRTADFLSDDEKTAKRAELDELKQLLDSEYLRLLSLAPTSTGLVTGPYAVIQFILEEGELELTKWALTTGTELCRQTGTVSPASPARFSFCCNNGWFRFQDNIIMRSPAEEQRLKGDVTSGYFVEDIHLYDVIEAESVCPKPVTETEYVNAEGIMAKDTYYRKGFSKGIRCDYLKARRKTQRGEQNVTVDSTGVRIVTPTLGEDSFLALAGVKTQTPFLSLSDDGLYVVEGAGHLDARRHPLGSVPGELVPGMLSQTFGTTTVKKAKDSDNFVVTHQGEDIYNEAGRPWKDATYIGTLAPDCQQRIVQFLLDGITEVSTLGLNQYTDGMLTFADGTSHKITDGHDITLDEERREEALRQQEREQLSLNIMTDKSLYGPWEERGDDMNRTWVFNADATLAVSDVATITQDIGGLSVKMDANLLRSDRKWTMDNHVISLTNIPLNLLYLQLDYHKYGNYSVAQQRLIDSGMAACKQSVAEQLQAQWQSSVGMTSSYKVVYFMPEKLQLQDSDGTVHTLLRDETTMTESELSVYREATVAFNERMNSLTGNTTPPSVQPTPSATPLPAATTTEAAPPIAEPVPATIEQQSAPLQTAAEEPANVSSEEILKKVQNLKISVPKVFRK